MKYVKRDSFSTAALKALGVKIIQIRKNAYATDEEVKKARLQIVDKDGVLMTAAYAKALENGPSAIEQLPTELRRHILSFLDIKKGRAIYLRGVYGPPTGIEFPPIAYVSTTIRAEYVCLALESTTFDIQSGPGNAKFQKWLEKTSLRSISSNYNTGFDAVKSLSFSYFSRYHHQTLPAAARNNDIELMLKCKNLEAVNMLWHGAELADPYGNPKSVGLLRTQYRLDRMLGLRNLKRIKIVRRMAGGAADIALQNLAAWFTANIRDRAGQAPSVTLV